MCKLILGFVKTSVLRLISLPSFLRKVLTRMARVMLQQTISVVSSQTTLEKF